MDIQMTAQADGRGKLTMEALAQAWDALTDRGAPPDATVQVQSSSAAGRWTVTARWAPADPEPDEAEAEAAAVIPLDAMAKVQQTLFDVSNDDSLSTQIRAAYRDSSRAVREQLDSFGLPPRKTMAERIQDQLARPLFERYTLDPAQIADAVRRNHHRLGYLNP